MSEDKATVYELVVAILTLGGAGGGDGDSGGVPAGGVGMRDEKPCSACGDGDTEQRFHKHEKPTLEQECQTLEQLQRWIRSGSTEEFEPPEPAIADSAISRVIEAAQEAGMLRVELRDLRSKWAPIIREYLEPRSKDLNLALEEIERLTRERDEAQKARDEFRQLVLERNEEVNAARRGRDAARAKQLAEAPAWYRAVKRYRKLRAALAEEPKP